MIGRKECPFSTRWKEKLAASAQVSRFVEKMKCLGWNHGTKIQLNFSAVIMYRKDLHCFRIPRSRVSGSLWLIRAPSRHFCEAEGEAFRASSRKDQLLLALKAWMGVHFEEVFQRALILLVKIF